MKQLSGYRTVSERHPHTLAFSVGAVILFLASFAYAFPNTDSAKAERKRYKRHDTVGIINGTPIYYQDFTELLYAIAKQSQTDSVVSDTAFTRYVDMTWNQIIKDFIVEEEIQKRKLTLSQDEVIKRLLRNPTKELIEAFSSPNGVFDSAACREYITGTGPDPTRANFLDYVQAQYEEARLVDAVTPNKRTRPEKEKLYYQWLAKQVSKARIIDRRVAFGYY